MIVHDVSMTNDRNGWRPTFLHRSHVPRPGSVRLSTDGPTPWRAGQEGCAAGTAYAARSGTLCSSGLPAVGRRCWARRLPGILPPLTPDETIEVSTIWSAARADTAGPVS